MYGINFNDTADSPSRRIISCQQRFLFAVLAFLRTVAAAAPALFFGHSIPAG